MRILYCDVCGKKIEKEKPFGSYISRTYVEVAKYPIKKEWQERTRHLDLCKKCLNKVEKSIDKLIKAKAITR